MLKFTADLADGIGRLHLRCSRVWLAIARWLDGKRPFSGIAAAWRMPTR